MRNYTLLMEDDRYSIPTLLFVTGGEGRAREMAVAHLLNSAHHLTVEIRADDRLIAKISRPTVHDLAN